MRHGVLHVNVSRRLLDPIGEVCVIVRVHNAFVFVSVSVCFVLFCSVCRGSIYGGVSVFRNSLILPVGFVWQRWAL